MALDQSPDSNHASKNFPSLPIEAVDWLNALERTLGEHVIVSATNTNGDIVYVNSEFCRVSGYSENELMGQNHRILNSGEHTKEFFKDIYGVALRGGIIKKNIWNLAKADQHGNRRRYCVSSVFGPIYADGKVVGIVGVRFEITNLLSAQDELKTALTEKEGELDVLKIKGGFNLYKIIAHGLIAFGIMMLGIVAVAVVRGGAVDSVINTFMMAIMAISTALLTLAGKKKEDA